MANNLAQWEAYFNARLSALFPSGFPAIKGGSVIESQAGWYTIPFGVPFTKIPTVVGIQGPRTSGPTGQTLTPPKLQAPTVTGVVLQSVNLTSLQIPVPATLQSWGDRAKQYIVNNCANTIGQIPVIGGYLCSGIDNTLGELMRITFNAVQGIYYTLDAPALLSSVQQQVEAKAAADYNLVLSGLQLAINDVIANVNDAFYTAAGDVNFALSDLTAVAQTGINAFYSILNEAIGLAEGLAIPVAQVRNITFESFDVYSPGGDTPVYWLAAAV
jgi:hypothetical protein